MYDDWYSPYSSSYGSDGEYNRYHGSYGWNPSAANEWRDWDRNAQVRDMYRYGGYGGY